MAAYALAEKRVLLRSHFLFKDLRQAEIDRIVKFARGESVDGGHVHFHKGDPAAASSVSWPAKLRLPPNLTDSRRSSMSSGPTNCLARRQETLGQRSWARGFRSPCRRSQRLPRPCQARPGVDGASHGHPCQRVRHVCDVYEDRIFLSVPARLAKKLLRLAEEFGSPLDQAMSITVKLTQARLGEMVGARRRIVNGLLGVWAESGLIDNDRCYIIVRHPDGLYDVIDELSDRRR